MGTDPYSPIIAIGACRFEMDQTLSMASAMFYHSITLESCMDLGLKPSASTITFWLTDLSVTKDAQKVFADPTAASLPLVLDAFTDWLSYSPQPDLIWGNSARFDCGLLEAAYKVCGKSVPWDFWNERCYRTVKNLPKAEEVILVRQGTYHNALDDALSQADHLRRIYKHLNL